MPVEIALVAEEFINANGYHNIVFYIEKKTSYIVPLEHIFTGDFHKKLYLKQTHAGLKLKINENLSLFMLFTTKAFTEITFNQNLILRMHNINISNPIKHNIFNYCNRCIFINDAHFSKYFRIDDNIKSAPKYTLDPLNENFLHPRLEESAKVGLKAALYTDQFILNNFEEAYEIVKDMQISENKTPVISNSTSTFIQPYTIRTYQYLNLNPEPSIPLNPLYGTDVKFLKHNNLTSVQWKLFQESVEANCNVKGDDIFKNIKNNFNL